MKWLQSRLLTVVLSIAVLLTLSVFVTSFTFNMKLPDNHQGYEPVQPISYSHRLHAGELGIPCLHCHGAAERSRSAGIPSTGLCMNCHRFVTAPWVDVRAEGDLAAKEQRPPKAVISPELAKLYAAAGVDSAMRPDPSQTPAPLEWVRVHNLPSFAYFNHSAHVNAGVDCQTCHGAVETMERVRQVSDLSMGWCVNCHRQATREGVKGAQVRASTDCTVCHH